MSESFPPPAAPPPDAPVEAARGRFALPEDPNRRALALGGIVLGVLLFLFVASRLLLGGGEEQPDDTFVPPPVTGSTTTTAVALPSDGTAETFEVFSTKNPFRPLVGSIGGGTTGGGSTGGSTGGGFTGGGTTGGGTTGGSTGGGTTGGGSTGGGTTATSRPSGASGGSANEPRRSERVALLDVLRRQGRLVAQVRVNDTVYTVGEGETFAGNYRVLSIDETGECARFIFGDEQFRLCRGEETLK